MNWTAPEPFLETRPNPAPPLRTVARRRRLQTPELSVVIVNYQQWKATAELVGQLRQSLAIHRGQAEIVIIDNQAPSHPLAARLRRLPAVSLRRWGRNRGFARGVNEGCRLSRGQWFLLLNPDMSVFPGFVDSVLAMAAEYASQEPRAGIVGLGLLNTDGTHQGSTGPYPSLTGTLARLVVPRQHRKYHLADSDRRQLVPWVTGCCLLMRRDCYRDLGGLDEEYFLYYEDVDLCRRARGRGWSVWHDPRLRVVHHHPLHQRAVPPHLRLYTRHALLTYGLKHWPRWQVRLLAKVVQLEAWARRATAHSRGHHDDAEVFACLERVAADLAGKRSWQARKRLDHVVREREKLRGW